MRCRRELAATTCRCKVGARGPDHPFRGVDRTCIATKFAVAFERDEKVVASYIGSQENYDTNLNAQAGKAQGEYLADAKVKLYVSRNHVSDFLAGVKSRKPPIAYEHVGARTAICCHLMNLTCLQWENIDWNPVELCIAIGSGDPKWLTRDYRGPWQI